MTYYTHTVGYTFKADNYCEECIRPMMTPKDATPKVIAALTKLDVEGLLDVLAKKMGVERYDEWTFDSGAFPKVIPDQFADDIRCGTCDERLEGEDGDDATSMLILETLEDAYPEVAFTIRSSQAWTVFNVRWTDGPTARDVADALASIDLCDLQLDRRVTRDDNQLSFSEVAS